MKEAAEQAFWEAFNPAITREACSSCGWVADPGQDVKEDRCPECDVEGCMTTYYGDPEDRRGENDVCQDWVERWGRHFGSPPMKPPLEELRKIVAERGWSEERLSRLAGFKRIRQVVKDNFTTASTELLSFDLELLDHMIEEEAEVVVRLQAVRILSDRTERWRQLRDRLQKVLDHDRD